jgi:hypothetical protein
MDCTKHEEYLMECLDCQLNLIIGRTKHISNMVTKELRRLVGELDAIIENIKEDQA